jgi:hypothetical protein
MNIRKGDAANLAFALSGEWQPGTCVCSYCIETTATIRRLLKMCRAIEDGKEEDSASLRNQVTNWTETARQYSRNADYWKERAESAERKL